VFQEICRTLIGPDADLYYNQAVLKPPGKGKSFGWHQDTQYIITEPLEYVTCWIAVGNATIENGTIWIVPGMHKHGLLPHIYSEESREWQLQFDDTDKIPVELRAGQMAVFNSLLPHCSGPNTSNEVRYAYVPQYHIAGVKKRGTDELVGDQFPLLRNGVAVSHEEPVPA
jgi:ectoine hydroxylase-related dioxygenase (phytanoyl-CoA dioxygenase family)